MRKPAIRRVSPTKTGKGGVHQLTGNWTGRPMPVFEGQRLGVVVGGDGDKVDLGVTLQAFREDGEPLTNGTTATMPAGKSLTYDFGLLPLHFEQVAKTTMRVTPQEGPDAAIETVIETYPGAWGMFGGDTLNPLPAPRDIEYLERQTGQALCGDHKRFLQTRNGINWTWWQDPVWNITRRDGERDFFDDLQELGAQREEELGLLADATYIFGAGEAHPYLSYPADLGDFGFYHAAFLRFAIPVGVDGGGNLFVQVLAGARRGAIMFVDHEYHFGMLDDADPPQLAPDIREGGPDKPLQAFTDDEFWDHMVEVGYAIPAATSLDAMIAALEAHHGALVTALAPAWRDVGHSAA